MPTDYLSVTKSYGSWWTFSPTWGAANTRIPTFLCPSAIETPTQGALFTTHYVNGGTLQLDGYIFSQASYPSLGKTNYLSVAGYFGSCQPPYDGMFHNRSRPSLAMITSADGTSNTLAFGEILGTADTGTHKYTYTWMAASMPTAWGLPTGPDPFDGWYHFSSRHQTVQFAFGDGSVRGLRKVGGGGNDWVTFIYATGWKEGGLTDLSSIAP